MTQPTDPSKAADLTGSLLARKGTANAKGFADRPGLAAPSQARPAVDIRPAIDAVKRMPQPEPPRPAPVSGRSARQVMVVEDNPLNMKLLTDLLEVHGYQAVGAVNGREALAYARLQRPDLIVMDIRLPGLSGLDTVRALKADPHLMTIPVIAVSATRRAEEAAAARGAGCDDFLVKPFSVQGVLATVARLLD